MKKLLCVLLVLAIAVSLSVTAFADEDSEVVWLDVTIPELSYYAKERGNFGINDCFYIEELDLLSLTVSIEENLEFIDIPYLIDRSTGKLVTDREYNYVYPFSDGRALVSKDFEVFGYVGADGKLVTPMEYSWATDFYNGTAIVQDSSGYKVIDRNGNTLKTLDGVTDLDVWTGATGLVEYNEEGSVLSGCMDVAGNVLIPVNTTYCIPLSGGQISVREYYQKSDKSVHFHTTIYSGSEPVLTLPEDLAVYGTGHLDKGYYVVVKEQTYEGTDSDVIGEDKWGLYDKDGNEVIPVEYKSLSARSDNVLEANGHYFDLNGTPIEALDNLYRAYLRFRDGVACCFDSYDEYYRHLVIVDEKGTQLLYEDGSFGGINKAEAAGKYILVSNYEGVIGYIENPIYDEYKISNKIDITGAFKDSITWALENDYAASASSSAFGSSNPCPRWEVVSIIWKAMDSPKPETTENPFTDVSESDPYYKAILWAYENGITTGISDTEFGVNATVKRGDAMTFIWRAASKPASDAENPFSDVAAGKYYEAPVLWAVENGITNGTDATHFAPENSVTRGQMVTFLYRWLVENK